MRYYKDEQKYILILKKGEKLRASLQKFASETVVKTAWFQALGAALNVEIGYYHLDRQEYQWKKLSGPLEITALSGNIVQKDRTPKIHMHGNFSDENYQVIGGHVKDLVVAGTCEILLQPLNFDLTRKLDDEVGLELLSSPDGADHG